ncbi:uncharacterized protein LOC143426388 [Xylocopa sonorina]|uniref:uncharacterized protein LOC143426388 n=1 Tax=Xylocopa sonorina TaxID=1818115 RepID=UPI00403AAD28
MEIGEGEAQICRLCGQYESIYIDVFGEEGTKRFLGLKIHTKINILIDERDPLPKAICVQCLGKLEFVCDFQEECLRTQQVLRDRYNLPPLTEIAEVKTEDTTPSTSTTNNNNNDINKNLNSPSDERTKNALRTATKTQRNLRSQHQGKGNEESAKDQSNIQSTSEDNTNTVDTIQNSETTPTRWLRSRQSTEATATNETTSDPPIANRLRSHDNTATEIIVSPRNNPSENGEKPSGKQQDPHTIQIPTSALNKLLSIVSNSPNIEVSVKESRNQSDIEDISFTVELCKKESDDVATARARVFPDQGSCLVDKAIVGLLQNQSCVEVNSIINTIINSSLKNGNSTKLKDSAEFEQKWQASQNPEELFKIDGEEIRVDDNVEHVVTDNQNGYSCKLCCKFYERKDKCMVHVKTHLGIKQYTCILCNAKFVCKSDVMKHIRCSHTNPRPIQCPKCPKRFKSKFYLMEHDNVHKGVRPYSCTDCGQSYHHKVSLQIHMKSHLPPQNLACEYCGKVFPYRTRLLSHIASVHLKNRRNFRCRFCYNLYSSLSVLNEHIKTRHATTYTCEVCTKTFKVASKYKAHVLQHSNPKPFVCNVCNNRYASKAFLNEHLLKHEGLRKHICQKCGARFAQASHLAAHRHVHGEKKHACPECGRKFNRRDNMKIKENDGLSQVICMRCLGTLEFLCDFYDRCHLTQKELLETSQNGVGGNSQEENEAEFDKENAAPPVNEAKRKARRSSPGGAKCIKKYLVQSKSRYENEEKEEMDCIDKNEYAKDIRPSVQTAVQLNNDISCLNFRRNLMTVKEDIVATTIVRVAKPMNDLDSSQNSERNVDINSELTIRRKRGRKSKSNKTRQTALAASLKKNSDLDDSMGNNLKSEFKSHYQRTIYRNSEPNCVINNAVISSKPKIEQVIATEQVAVVDTTSNGVYAKGNEIDIMYNNFAVVDKSTEIASDYKDAEDRGNRLRDTEDRSAKSKAISVIVKQERGETENAPLKQNDESNQPDLIPSGMLAQTVENFANSQNQLGQENVALTRFTPLLLEGTGNSESNETDLIVGQTMFKDSDREMLSTKLLTGQNRVTVIKSSQLVNENPKITQEGSEESCVALNAAGQSSKSEIERNISEPSLPRQFTRDSFNQNKSKDRTFGKISELISDEQKQTIETYYTVNMSMVNSEEVQKNITIVDKKNIRCNICGTLYLRMDKCQVHIWGHLQMKPYQCKACDFSTVTISNVRCHIRKSHLKIKPFACHLCEKRYVTAILLEEHINTHTGARPYKCKLCDFASSSRQILSYHNAIHKPLKDINCKFCGKEFYSKSRLRAHMIVHNKDKAIMCKLCSAYLSNEEALETHHRNIHMQDYVCNICGKHVKSRKALHNHQNVHAVAKYKCNLCPNVYKSSQILKEHLLKHEGIRKYKCNVCEKAFAQQSHLAAHMAVHSKIRFHCPGCDKGFNRHDNMKIHTKRCKPFLANPDLKNLLTKKERTISFNNITELTAELKHENVSNSISPVSFNNENNDILVKTIEDTQETAINLCKLGLNISCIDSSDKIWNHDNMYDEKEETRSTEIKITNFNDRLLPKNENLSVLENILRPESY